MKFYRFCKRCGKPLKTTEAMARGMGEMCREHVKHSPIQRPLFESEFSKKEVPKK